MPTGIYPRTEFHKECLRNRGGWHLSEETKRKIGLANKGKKHPIYVGFQKRNTINLGQSYSKDRKIKIGLTNSKPKIILQCKECEKNYSVYQFEKNIRKFCSVKCRQKYTRQENHYRWNGGLSTLVDKIRATKEYKNWRFSIFQRDNFTCSICKKSKDVRSLLQADHYPITRAEMMYKYNIKSVENALNCKYFWDINNGRTLCEDCHKQTDTFGGKNYKRVKEIFNLPIRHSPRKICHLTEVPLPDVEAAGYGPK